MEIWQHVSTLKLCCCQRQLVPFPSGSICHLTSFGVFTFDGRWHTALEIHLPLQVRRVVHENSVI